MSQNLISSLRHGIIMLYYKGILDDIDSINYFVSTLGNKSKYNEWEFEIKGLCIRFGAMSKFGDLTEAIQAYFIAIVECS